MAINSGFSHWNWWFSIVMLNYQRVVNPPFFRGFEKASWPCDFGRSTLVNFCRVLPRRVLCMGSCGMIKQVVTHAMRVTNFSIQFENFGVTILIHFTISTVKKLGAAPNHGTKKSVVVKWLRIWISSLRISFWIGFPPNFGQLARVPPIWSTIRQRTNGWPLVSVLF